MKQIDELKNSIDNSNWKQIEKRSKKIHGCGLSFELTLTMKGEAIGMSWDLDDEIYRVIHCEYCSFKSLC